MGHDERTLLLLDADANARRAHYREIVRNIACLLEGASLYVLAENGRSSSGVTTRACIGRRDGFSRCSGYSRL